MIHSSDAIELALRAQAFVDADDLRCGIAGYRDVLQQAPGFAAGWNNLGSALHAIGDIDAAMQAWLCALDADPAFRPAQSNFLVGLIYSSAYSPEQIAQCHFQWGAGIPKHLPLFGSGPISAGGGVE